MWTIEGHKNPFQYFLPILFFLWKTTTVDTSKRLLISPWQSPAVAGVAVDVTAAVLSYRTQLGDFCLAAFSVRTMRNTVSRLPTTVLVELLLPPLETEEKVQNRF